MELRETVGSEGHPLGGEIVERGSLSHECLSCELARQVRAVYQLKLEAMARRVVFRMRRLTASGMLGDDLGLRTLWDEFCLDQQSGPAAHLDWPWDSLLHTLIADIISAVSSDEQCLFTVASGWLVGEFDVPICQDEELIRRAVQREVIGMALNRHLNKISRD